MRIGPSQFHSFLVFLALSGFLPLGYSATPLETRIQLQLTNEHSEIDLGQCLKKAASNNKNVKLTSLNPDWIISISTLPPQENRPAVISLLTSKPFDTKSDINRWMAGLPQPLSYGAVTALRGVTSHLVRNHRHWMTVLPKAGIGIESCEQLFDDILDHIH